MQMFFHLIQSIIKAHVLHYRPNFVVACFLQVYHITPALFLVQSQVHILICNYWVIYDYVPYKKVYLEPHTSFPLIGVWSFCFSVPFFVKASGFFIAMLIFWYGGVVWTIMIVQFILSTWSYSFCSFICFFGERISVLHLFEAYDHLCYLFAPVLRSLVHNLYILVFNSFLLIFINFSDN